MVRPYSKVTVVTAPFALTVPFKVAETAVTELAATVVTVGAEAGQAAVVKVWSAPLMVPPMPLLPLTRKWYWVLQVRLLTGALTAELTAPAASGLCVAVTELP